MKTELHYYDIFPKVFPKDKEIEITQTEITFSVSVPLIKHNEIIQQL